MQKSKLEELGQLMSNAFHNADDTRETFAKMNQDLHVMAMEISGVRVDELTNDDMDNSSIVRLYWVVLSELTAKMFIEAAQQQSMYRQLGRSV